MEQPKGRDWLYIALLLLLSNAPDFLLPLGFFEKNEHGEGPPYWALYVFNLFIDSSVAALIFKGLFIDRWMPEYVQFIGWCFVVSTLWHNLFFLNQYLSTENPYDVFEQFNRFFYLEALKCIVVAQWVALFWGGHGIIHLHNRERRIRRADADRLPAVLYSPSWTGFRHTKEEQTHGD